MRISCKICRRFGASLCGREKCAFRRKPYAPGIHGRGKKRRREGSEFAVQLREKQRARFLYAVSEKQFSGYVKKALKGQSGDAGRKLTEQLELRLDNVVLRLGFANSIALARQLVAHGHFNVDGRRVFTPSYATRIGQVITLRPASATKGAFKNLDVTLKKHQVPNWLSLSLDKKEGKIESLPKVEDMVRLYDTKSIIEYYSR